MTELRELQNLLLIPARMKTVGDIERMAVLGRRMEMELAIRGTK